jgi:hypothetical protein
MYKLIETNYLLDNGFRIFKGLCSCLTCRIKIKLIDLYVQENITKGNISITHDKIFDLIKEYGIKETKRDYILIETNELLYYIDISENNI